ncbi:hypothetical protein SAMN05216207_101945 [Pseudonocardia ammonioxydans]|uniref:DUF4190 domain-containing protein n=1 Tax=Pseudonocardia ammonioxydans TaxID=260086 RepID=A0A1I5B2C8_PSUAM|nr:hypothetical protein [Pseudonocardia ammonioxydans]SFN68845.1 hypothetical protein SAMN05216207_101945 [Pseudonocardia ammonioxydans]
MSNVQSAAKPTLAYVSLALGALGLIAGFLVPLFAWVLGVAGLITGFLAFRQPGLAKLGQIGMVVGFVAILVGVYHFTSLVA